MQYLKEYQKCVIEPLEKMRDEITKKYFTSFFLKKYYKKMLDKVNNELLNKYQRLYELNLSKKDSNF